MNLLTDDLFLCDIGGEPGTSSAAGGGSSSHAEAIRVAKSGNANQAGDITFCGTADLSLPGVLWALANDRVSSFPRLRPHQRPYFHMFLCQLAAMAIEKGVAGDFHNMDANLSEALAGLKGIETATEPKSFSAQLGQITPAHWESLLLGLTPDFPKGEAWELVPAEKSLPGFLQPVCGDDAKAPAIEGHPDDIDLPSTSRAHAQKAGAIRSAAHEHWIHALICRQTAGGYGGKGNYGVMRAPGGSHPRVFCGLTPSFRPGAWFCRDVLALLATKSALLAQYGFLDSAHSLPLLWTKPWDGSNQIAVGELGPWSIEICQRLRLVTDANGAIRCERRLSAARRIAEGLSKSTSLLGRIGDPWSPIFLAHGSTAKLEPGRPDLEWTASLLFDETRYKLPVLAERIPAVDGEGALKLAVRGVHSEDSKTSWSERIIDLPARRRFSFGNSAINPATSMLADIEIVHSDILMPAMFAWFEADGVKLAPTKAAEVRREWYPHIREAFTAATETAFFSLAFEAMEDGEGAAKLWRDVLRDGTRRAFDAFLEKAPRHQETWRPRRTRGLGALEALLSKKLPKLETAPISQAIHGDDKKQGTNAVTPQPQTPTHRQIVATATAKMIGMIADPNLPAGHLASLATLDLSDLSGRMPSAFWRILGGALPIELQEDTESGERNNWAALMKIIAIAVAKGLVGAGAARPLPIGHALREANFNERRFFHLVSTPSREDMRVTLTDSVRQFADKGIAFDIQEAAQLLLLDYPDRDQALEKLDRDWNMARKGA